MSFAVPVFLVAMLAGLIPVLLHMINQQKAKTIPFSTLRFLRLGAQKTRRRKYLHDILLLALRAAALMLIALALARPTLTQLGNLLGSSDSSAVVLVLDNSASMSTVDVGGSRWDAALAAAHEIIDQLDDRDSVALLLTCGPPRPALDRLYQNQEVIRQTLAECRVGYEQADLAAQIRSAEGLLQESTSPNKEIYVITDMQAVSWDSALESNPAAGAEELPPVILVDVHREPLPNVAVVDVSLHSAGPVAGLPIQATVRLQGDLTLEQQRHVELLIDEELIETSPTIALSAGATAEQSFNFAIDQPGLHSGTVRLVGDDSCTTDDQRSFAISVTRNIPVAVVKQAEREIAYLEDSYYLERALNPVDDDDWAIQTDRLSPSTLATSSLQKYAVVFCVNLRALDSAVAARLHEYVLAGGHVVWICGDNVEVNPYNTMNQSSGGELLPAPITELHETDAAESDGWSVGWIDTAHPALSAFAQPQSLYQSVLVSKLFGIADVDEATSHVLAKLEDGQPLLIERQVGRGTVLLLGTSVHVDWSNLPLRPLFLPLVARLTFHLADAQATQQELSAGRPIQIVQQAVSPNSANPFRPNPGQGGLSHEVTRPGGEVVRVDAEEGAERLRYTDTHEIGIYKIRSLVDGDRPEQAVAVNLDPAEIPAAISAPAAIAAVVGENRLIVCPDPQQIAATIGDLRQGRSLMEFFLIAVLVMLIAEAYLANRRVEQEQPDELRQLRSVQPTYRRLPEHLDDLAEQIH
jgi:hypothetical protein